MEKNKKTELLRATKYLFIAASAGLIQIGSFTLLNEVLKMKYLFAYIISLILSVLWNFTINRKYTFRTVANVTYAMLEVLGYYLIFTPLSTWWGDALVGIGWNEYLVLAITMIINLVTEYAFYYFVVYRNKIDNAVKKKQNEKDKTNTPEL